MLLLMEERNCPVGDSGGVSKWPEPCGWGDAVLELQGCALKINPCSACLRGHLWHHQRGRGEGMPSTWTGAQMFFLFACVPGTRRELLSTRWPWLFT